MSGKLQDRVAVVTGAGQGIGAAIARRFATEGARVVIAELNADTGAAMASELRAAGHTALVVPTNVGDSQSVVQMVSVAIEHFGPPDILINNAGINVFSDPLTLGEADWQRC